MRAVTNCPVHRSIGKYTWNNQLLWIERAAQGVCVRSYEGVSEHGNKARESGNGSLGLRGESRTGSKERGTVGFFFLHDTHD